MDTLSSAEATVNKQPTTVVLPGLQNFGQAVLADYCGDMVLYRSLKPIDSRLPNIRRAMFEAGLAGTRYRGSKTWIMPKLPLFMRRHSSAVRAKR